MKALANLDPRLTTAAGIGSGFVSWILGHIEILTQVASFFGALFGALIALISLVVKLRDLWGRRRRSVARERGRQIMAEAQEPPDVDDNIPLQ